MTPAPRWLDQKELERHFRKHGHEFPCRTIADYAASALATIEQGRKFTFEDRDTLKLRIGYYIRRTNHLVVLTSDGQFIVSYFRPDRGRRYCAELPFSTYK